MLPTSLHLSRGLRRETKTLIEVAKKVSSAIVAVSLLAGTAAGQKKNERPPVSVPNEFRGAEISVPTDQTSIGD